MKALNLLVLALIIAGTAHAQGSSAANTTNPPSVEITQVNYHREVFVPALYEDPMHANQDQVELMRDQRATIKQNAERTRQGQTPLPLPSKKIASNMPVGSTPMGVPLGEEPVGNRNLPAAEDPGPSSIRYVYEAKIKNSGAKTIRSVFWTYLLLDKETKEVAGRHHFRSNVSLRTGKTANLIGRSKNPPTQVVHVPKSDKQIDQKYDNAITIDLIEYEDGTLWRHPEPPASPEQPR